MLLKDLLDLVPLLLLKLLAALKALNSQQDLTNPVHLKDLVLLKDLQDLDTLVVQLDLQRLNRQVSLRALADQHILRVPKVLLNLVHPSNLKAPLDLVLLKDLKDQLVLDTLVLLKVP